MARVKGVGGIPKSLKEFKSSSSISALAADVSSPGGQRLRHQFACRERHRRWGGETADLSWHVVMARHGTSWLGPPPNATTRNCKAPACRDTVKVFGCSCSDLLQKQIRPRYASHSRKHDMASTVAKCAGVVCTWLASKNNRSDKIVSTGLDRTIPHMSDASPRFSGDSSQEMPAASPAVPGPRLRPPTTQRRSRQGTWKL